MNRECVGSFIRAKRKEKGLTQKQLGDMIGLSDRAVSRWENGIGLPDVEILLPLSEALGVTVDELLAGEEKRCLAISSQEDAATKVIRSFRPKRFLIFCLAGIITLCSCVLVMNRETVRYSDGSFYLVKQGGQYYPYFKVSDDIDCNSYLDTSLIPPSDTTASYDLYGMDIAFGPGNCSKKYANLHELKRDTVISIDPVISRFSDSKCLVYMNQTNDS